MSYITDADLAAYVGTPDVQDTGLLQGAIEAACKQIDLHCHRTFTLAAANATTRVYAVSSRTVAWVDDFATTDGLVIRTDDNDDGLFETTWTPSDYELMPIGARLPDGSAGVYYEVHSVDLKWFPTITHRRGVLEVTAKWGWPEIPAPVKQAALELAKDAYAARLNRGGVILTDVGAVSVRTNRLAAAWLAPFVRHERQGIA